METSTSTERLLIFVEDFANFEPGSDFAVFILTWSGIIIGIMFSISMEGFLMGGYNVGKIITIVLCISLGIFMIGMVFVYL